MPYSAKRPLTTPSADELRERIPGWGADLDPADRPAFPREQWDLIPEASGKTPEQQPGGADRERSLEHERLTPVFGTAQPLHGVSGAIRRFAYERFSEGKTVHWLLLVLGDRVEAAGSTLRSLASGDPDDPVRRSGVLGEAGRRPVDSRTAPGRVDDRHSWMDPAIVSGPWLAAAGLVAFLIVRARRR